MEQLKQRMKAALFDADSKKVLQALEQLARGSELESSFIEAICLNKPSSI